MKNVEIVTERKPHVGRSKKLEFGEPEQAAHSAVNAMAHKPRIATGFVTVPCQPGQLLCMEYKLGHMHVLSKLEPA